MSIITLTTDWKQNDFYTGALKGTILTKCPEIQIVDISHQIPSFNISQAAFVIKNSYYHFPKGTRDIAFLKRAWLSMEKVLDEEWKNREANLPFKTAYEALILASIVEKETGRADERPIIAGVFVRRLIKGMRLQTDPTVIYGMGEKYDGNIRKRDLLRDTPYNTYTRSGLTPTPIAMPGRAAINAVMHPAKGKSLYFVAKGDHSGSHVFSATLKEHNRAVDYYQKKIGRK